MVEIEIALQTPDSGIPMRLVRLADADALRRQCWPERDFESVYRFISRARQIARQGRGLGVVVVDDVDRAVGYGQLTLWPRCSEISDLIVNDAYRGQGLGTALIQYLTRAAREIHADCVEIGAALSNPGAVALYCRLGFRDTRIEKMNLGNGDEDVLYLRIKLI